MEFMHVGRLLLAEDDDEMRRLLASVLRNDGYTVVEAADGQEMLDALTAAQTGGGDPINLVVADVRMPRLTGLEVLEQICGAHVTAPVILITAFGDPVTHEKAYELGAAAVLDKPFEFDDLRSVVLYFSRRAWNKERLPEGFAGA